MNIRNALFLSVFFFVSFQFLHATPLAEQFKRTGYIEIHKKEHEAISFGSLYVCFDSLVEFLKTNPVWAQKLYRAKERFIRSKERNYYSTDFFGFYDESERAGRNQVSFYYSIHFHEFICSFYPEFKHVPEFSVFFAACLEIQKTYEGLFNEAAVELGLETLFASKYGRPPVLIKVVKYYPSYIATKPHYDGTAFSLFLDSTDCQSLLLSPYKPALAVDDFFSPQCNKNTIILIPGVFLREFSIYPTPHIVAQSGITRYATIAFAMRPNYTPKKCELSPLPNFQVD